MVLQPWTPTVSSAVILLECCLRVVCGTRSCCAFVSLSSCCWRGVRCAVLCARSCVRCTAAEKLERCESKAPTGALRILRRVEARKTTAEGAETLGRMIGPRND